MFTDYHTYKRDTLDALKGIGRAITKEQAIRRMSPAQARKARAPNFMTDDTFAWRSLANGSLMVEVSYGFVCGSPMLGLTVFCVGDLKADAPEWDHSLSGLHSTIAELAGRMAVLESGGRERLEALAKAAS